MLTGLAGLVAGFLAPVSSRAVLLDLLDFPFGEYFPITILASSSLFSFSPFVVNSLDNPLLTRSFTVVRTRLLLRLLLRL